MNNPVAPFWPGSCVEAKEGTPSRRDIPGKEFVQRVMLDESQTWGLTFTTRRGVWFPATDFVDAVPEPPSYTS